MSMERRTMRNLLKIPPVDIATNPIGLISKSKQEALKKNSENIKGAPYQKGVPPKFARGSFTRGSFPRGGPNKFGVKRSFKEEEEEFSPSYKKFKPIEKSWPGNILKRKL